MERCSQCGESLDSGDGVFATRGLCRLCGETIETTYGIVEGIQGDVERKINQIKNCLRGDPNIEAYTALGAMLSDFHTQLVVLKLKIDINNGNGEI